MLSIQRKGDKPRDLTRLTKASLLAIGERAMQSYLTDVTGTVAKRSKAKGVQQLKDFDTRTAGDAVEGVMSLTPTTQLAEFGGVVRAKNVRYMAIPLKAAKNSDGSLKRPSARMWRRARVITSSRGNLVIAVRQGRRWVPLYSLKKEVRVRGRLGLRRELSKQQPAFWKQFGREVGRLLDATV